MRLRQRSVPRRRWCVRSRCRGARLLQPHATKSVFTLPIRIFSVVAKNQNPGLVAIAHNDDRLRIEIAEINPDVLWGNAGRPGKTCEGFAPSWNRSTKSPAMIKKP